MRMNDDIDLVERHAEEFVASITSRPLFINVDESIVILGPIDHVG